MNVDATVTPNFASLWRRQWGMVRHVKEAVSAAKNRPRVGKAISILLEVNPAVVNEWFA